MASLGYLQDPEEIDIEIIADADICLYLAQKAAKAKNWRLAIGHCRKGLELLQKTDLWTIDERANRFVFALRAELAYAEQRNANFPETLRILKKISVSSLPVEQQLEIGNLKALTLAALNQREKAIDCILELFQSIGFVLETTPPQFSLDDLRSLPKMETKDLALLAILKTLGELIYTARPDLYWPLLCTEMTLSLEKGHSEYAPQCYTDYALALLLNGEIEHAKELSEFAINLLKEDREVSTSEASALLLHYGMVSPWINLPLSKTIAPLKQAFQVGVENWEKVAGGAAAVLCLDHSRILGEKLSECEEEYIKQISYFKELRWEEHQLTYAEIGKQLVLKLQGKKEELDFHSQLPQLIQEKNLTSIFLGYLSQVVFNYLMGNSDVAVTWAKKGESFISACPGLIITSEFHFYYALALYSGSQYTQAEDDLRILREWSFRCPENFAHWYCLAQAEWLRVQQQNEEAESYYLRSITLAKEQGRINDAALAHELTGRFYLVLGEQELAKQYLIEAHAGFTEWGAFAVVERLERDYDCLRSQNLNTAFSQAVCNIFLENIGPELRVFLNGAKVSYEQATKSIILTAKSSTIAAMIIPCLALLHERSPGGVDIVLKVGNRIILKVEGERDG